MSIIWEAPRYAKNRGRPHSVLPNETLRELMKHPNRWARVKTCKSRALACAAAARARKDKRLNGKMELEAVNKGARLYVRAVKKYEPSL